MTKAQDMLAHLDDEQRRLTQEWFGDLNTLYAFFYSLIQREHLTEQNHPEDWENQLKSIQFYRKLCSKRVKKECGLSQDLLEEIYSDYFEDFAHYREKNLMEDKVFISFMRKLIM